MSAVEVHLAESDPLLEELRLAAQLRRGFRHAQLLMAHSLGEHDLSALSYHLLLEVGAAGSEGVVQGELADLLQCPAARVSMLLRDLTDRGLVRGARSAPDRRVVRIRATPEGVRVAHAALLRQRESLSTLSEYAGLPSVTSLLRAALRLYLGVDMQLPGFLVPAPEEEKRGRTNGNSVASR